MKQGGDRKKSSGFTRTNFKVSFGGFTIVETLIVLAVTGALLTAAILLINGKQNKTEFYTAINNLQQKIQQIINETASGYYPNSGDFTCVGTSSPVTFSTSANGQGSNGGCIFLGKIVQFGTDTESSQLTVLPIVGNQYKSGTVIETLANAAPRAIVPATGETNIPDASVTEAMHNGLSVASANGTYTSSGMYYVKAVGGGQVSTGMVGFLAGDDSGNIASSTGGLLQSGSQQFSLYGVKTSTPNESVGDASKVIGNNTINPSGGNLEAASSISICIASATTNQSGLFTIGAEGGLGVKLAIMQGKTC